MAKQTEAMQSAVARWSPMPEVELQALRRMTDDTGLFQHAIYCLPDLNHGYCIDDNVRALIAGLLHAQRYGYDEEVLPLQRYLTFVRYAYNPDKQVFRNFMGYDRRWLEDEGSMDSQGRAIWGLGMTAAMAPWQVMRRAAMHVLNDALPAVRNFTYLRSWAFAMLGVDALLKVEPDHMLAGELLEEGAAKLMGGLHERETTLGDGFADWPWWEDVVTYDNAKLCQGLLVAGQRLGNRDMVDAALRSLTWLMDIQTAPAGHLSIVGNDGWYPRGGEKAMFDQQALEAYALVEACLLAGRITQESAWLDRAWMCFEWFTGKNDLGQPLYHDETGGCQDGLEPDRVNQNQGAESILAYLLRVLALPTFADEH